MTPSAGKSPPSSTRSVDIKDIATDFSPESVEKENQRPPIYNPEDYLLSLKKYGKRGSIASCQSVYEKNDDPPDGSSNNKLQQMNRSKTLPAKKTVEKSASIASTTSPSSTTSTTTTASTAESEMSLRQFGSITDLLTKLRSDLRSSFVSFVQEFVATPVDGVSLLLEVLRALQLSQTASFDKEVPITNGFRNQQFQRRALLDELACLQCLSICCSRSPEAGTRLGTSPIGLLPLAVSATGAGIRSRILALQLLTVACDKVSLSDGSHRTTSNGHAAVSDALSTLRLRCGEPVRFRLMVGMFNSGGGSGELQAYGLRFINTFVESAENLQDKLYLQAELNQAGFDPKLMTKTVSSTSHWFEKLHEEVRRWEVQRVDVEALQAIALNAEQLRSKMIMLERRVTTLQDEKNVLTTMERRLQERCAELQKEVRRLRESQLTDAAATKNPVALPRQQVVKGKQINSEHEDEGISGSDTGQSISPEPYQSQSQKGSNKFSIILTEEPKDETTIEDVIEELENIVSDAERDMVTEEILEPEPMSIPYSSIEYAEHEIIPSNLLPAPPKKSKSLAQLFNNNNPSDVDSSDYMIVDPPAKHKQTQQNYFADDRDEKQRSFEEHYVEDTLPQPDLVSNTRIPRGRDNGTNRALLNVIMDAREKERHGCRPHSLERDLASPQQLGGLFFITDTHGNNGGRFKDATTTMHHQAIEPRRVSRSLDKMGNCGVDSMIDIIDTTRASAAAATSTPHAPGLRARISTAWRDSVGIICCCWPIDDENLYGPEEYEIPCPCGYDC